MKHAAAAASGQTLAESLTHKSVVISDNAARSLYLAIPQKSDRWLVRWNKAGPAEDRNTHTHVSLLHLACSAKGRRGSLRASSFCHLLARRQCQSSWLANSECFFDLKQAGIHVDCVRPSGWTVAEEKPHTSCSFSVHLEEFLTILAIVLALSRRLYIGLLLCEAHNWHSPYSLFVSVMYVRLKPNIRRLLAREPGIHYKLEDSLCALIEFWHQWISPDDTVNPS